MLIEKIRRHSKAILAVLAFWGAYLVPLFLRTFQVKESGVFVGVGHMWSDWPLHLGIARIFATKAPADWLVYHPLYAEGRFTYTFLNDAISGFLMRAGFDLYPAFVIPAVIESLFLCLGLYVFLYLLLRSRIQALLGIAIFFCSSGPGILRVFSEIAKTGNWQLLLGVKEFTSYEPYAWYSGNILDGFLLPQRSMLLGMPIVLWSMIGVLWVLQSTHLTKLTRRSILVASGVLAGMLPIIHAHSLIVEAILMGMVFLRSRDKWKEMLIFFALPVMILAPAFLMLIRHKGLNSGFFVWNPGWNAKDLVDWIKMWSALFGMTVPLAVAGLIYGWKKFSDSTRMVFVGFFATFAFTNLFLTQRGPWDNSKIFMWVYLGFSALAALALHTIWRIRFIGKFTSVASAVVACGAGLITLIYLQRVDLHTFQILSAEDQKLAQEIHAATGPHDRFLTAPVTDSMVMSWAARPILMAFYSWVENYGFNAKDVFEDEQKIYSGSEVAPDLIRKHQVRYVVIGPAERHDLKANEAYFEEHYPVAFANPRFRIYDVRRELEVKDASQ